MIPNHTLGTLLKSTKIGSSYRTVLKGTYNNRACVIRVVGIGKNMAVHSSIVRQIAMYGRGSIAGLPEDVVLVLEGYRTAVFRLRNVVGIPKVLDAGILGANIGGPFPSAPGYVYVTTTWVEGETLNNAWHRLTLTEKEYVLSRLVSLLAELHARHVVFGDLKPENVVIRKTNGIPTVSLIDLDTLREVADNWSPVVTKDLTERFAAPEMLKESHVYISSDVYAFGKIIECLFEKPTGYWAEIVKLTTQRDPLKRPAAYALLDMIKEGKVPVSENSKNVTGSENTVRVDEPDESNNKPYQKPEKAKKAEETTRIEEPVLPPDAPKYVFSYKGEKPVKKLGITLIGVILVIFFIFMVIIFGGYYIYQQELTQEANSKADLAYQSLKEHKILAAKNTDDVLDEIVKQAAEAVEVKETAKALGVYSLARIWQLKWHHYNGKWNEKEYEEADQLTRKALEKGNTKEALFARAFIMGNACRLIPNNDIRKDALCKDSKFYYKKAERAIPKIPENGWLIVELHWAAEMVSHVLALAYEDAIMKEAEMSVAMYHCKEADEFLQYAPVNGIYLIRNCLSDAGIIHDYEQYLYWSSLLIQHDSQETEKVKTENTRRIFTSALLECGDLKTLSDGTIATNSHADPEEPATFCSFAGMIANGCAIDAYASLPYSLRLASAMPIRLKKRILPWNDLFSAAEKRPLTKCYLQTHN